MNFLPWLAPADETAALLEATLGSDDPARRLDGYRRLAQRRIPLSGAVRVAKAIAADTHMSPSTAKGRSLAHATVTILAEGTVDHIIPWIPLAGIRRNAVISAQVGPFDQIVQHLMSGQMDTPEGSESYVLLVPNIARRVRASESGLQSASKAAAAAFDEISAMVALVSDRHRARPIVATAPPKIAPLFGSHEAGIGKGGHAAEEALNDLIRQAAFRGEFALLDIAALCSRYGHANIFDRRLWYKARYAVAPQAAELVADRLGRLVAGEAGKSRKLLVLDLDNTLWGGVVGEAGIAGLELGEGSPVGEAHHAFQSYVKDLSRRGVVLAVCSKNDSALAIETIRDRDGMVLKLDDFAAIEANYSNKADNIVAIARRLDLGLDSVVFVDDAPIERHLVRNELPMVAVPEMGDDPAAYVDLLADAGYFEATEFAVEDTRRTELYRDNAKRDTARAVSRNLEEFLRSLDQTVTIAHWAESDFVRIVQLINKTNQFNLTTCRFNADSFRAYVAQKNAFVLTLRVKDRFGDAGLVGIAMVAPIDSDPLAFRIDNLLMSCRVLARGVENAFMAGIVRTAVKLGAHEICGRYTPTARNALVKDFYNDQGFAGANSDAADGSIEYRAQAASFVPCSYIGKVDEE